MRLLISSRRFALTVAVEPLPREILVALLRVDVELLDVGDAPEHEEVDRERLLLGSRDSVRLGTVEHERPLVVELDVLQQRPLRVKPGSSLCIDDLAQLELDRVFRLLDRIEHLRRDEQDRHQQRHQRHGELHRVSPGRSRLRSASRARAGSSGRIGRRRGRARGRELGCGRRRDGGRSALLEQLVERQIEEIAAGLLVDQHLARVAEHHLHGVDVEALAGDSGRLRVFGEDLPEARRVAFRPLHDRGEVAVRFFEEPRRVAARARHDVVGIRLSFVAEAVAVLARLHRVVECRLHLVRRLDALQRDFLYEDARFIAVEHVLHQLLGGFGDLLAAFVEHEVHLRLADDLAHCRLGDKLDDLLRVAHVEDVRFGVVEVVLDW